jgi:Domain of unknown function (DUF1918)
LQEAMSMQARVGDRLHVHSRTVGTKERIGEIIEVRGTAGQPPYVVRFPDGHENLVYPGPDCVVEPAQR